MISYRIFPQAQLIVVKSSGETTAEEYLQFMKQLRNDENYSRSYDVLSDSSGLSNAPSSAQLQSLAEARYDLEKNLPPPERRVAILANKDLQFGIGRMFQALAENLGQFENYMVFRDIDKAIEWLDKKTIPNEVFSFLSEKS